MELPVDFVKQTEKLFGEERYSRFVAALSEKPVVSVRHNPYKQTCVFEGEPVAWASDACYLSERPSFTADPLFHAGCYYVQEASSMFLEQVIRQYTDTPVRMLDLCAAPGGKSTHAVSLLPEGSFLVVNEPMPLRAEILAENMIKWGKDNVVVTRNDPADFAVFKNFFDLILVDAPCSGEGMFRKDSKAAAMWSLSNVETCASRQRDILGKIWRTLRPGGLLIYSTCTFNSCENEENVAWIRDELGADVLPVNVREEWNVTGNLFNDEFPVYRFLPGFTRGEGFFLALLRKHGDSSVCKPRSVRVRNVLSKQHANVKSWLHKSEDYLFTVENDRIYAVPTVHHALIASLQECLKVLHCGIPMGTVKNKTVLPLHALAMSNMFDKSSFPVAELDYEQAVSYLHREALFIPEAENGIILLTYKDMPLGFAKNLGNRVNNLYPAEWRIRKSPVEL